MIYAYEEGNSLRVVDYTDDGTQNLFCDATGEHLFRFVDTDLSKFMELFLTYFDSRIDRASLECKDSIPLSRHCIPFFRQMSIPHRCPICWPIH